MPTTSPFYTIQKEYDATKGIGIPISQLPDEAWSFATGGPSGTKDVQEHYDAVGWLYRCVQVRANALSLVPWVIERGEDVIWKKDDDMPLEMEWLKMLPQLLWLTEAANVLVGNSFWFIEKNRVKPLNLRWLSPFTMTPQWDSRAGLTHYMRDIGDGNPAKRFELDEIVYFWLLNPLHETEPGRSPAEAALASAGVLMSIDEFAKGFFDRGAIKATLLAIPGNTNKAEKEKLEAWWRRFFQGMSKAWSSNVVASGTIEAVPVGEGMESLSNNTLTTERREDIATSLGIPHSIVFSNAANFATAQTDERNFFNLTILPSAAIIASTINDQLLKPLGLHLRFLWQELPIFQEDEEQRSAALVNLVNAGIPLEAALQILGYHISDEAQAIIAESMVLPELPEQNETEESEPIDVIDVADEAEKVADLSRWKRKAKKALKRGDSAAVSFESEYIDDIEAVAIRQMLIDTDNADDIDAVFAKVAITPDGSGESRLPTVQAEITEHDILASMRMWDKIFPEYAGMLDAEVTE